MWKCRVQQQISAISISALTRQGLVKTWGSLDGPLTNWWPPGQSPRTLSQRRRIPFCRWYWSLSDGFHMHSHFHICIYTRVPACEYLCTYSLRKRKKPRIANLVGGGEPTSGSQKTWGEGKEEGSGKEKSAKAYVWTCHLYANLIFFF